jgi:hypothetical protein
VYKFLKRHRKVCFLVLFFLILFVCEAVHARAGGGGGFRSGSSGGGFGGGSYRGGGDSGGGLFLLMMFVFQYPYISVPVILVIIMLSLLGGSKANHARQNHRIQRGLARLGPDAMKRAMDKILSRDPDFNEQGLCERVKGAFLVIQQAWSDMDMKKARAFISDGIYERFTLQLAIYADSMLKNTMADVNVHHCEIVAMHTDEFFDSVDVKITASAVDCYINTEKNKCISDDPSPETFVEYWTLLRRPGAKTKTTPGLLENCCPNCGEPLPLLDRTECPSCKALVNSGEYDWVLSEITQESEYSVRPPRNIPGLDAMRKVDPGFNVSHIEDRASVIFYRHIAGQFFGDAKYLFKLSSNEYLHTNRDDFKTQPDGTRRFFADVAVGCVELVEVISEDNAYNDFLRILIRWSGHKVSAQIPGFLPPDFAASRLYQHEIILERQKGVKSSDKNILSSIHCPNCGAPETKSNKPLCEYCHTPLNDGSRDWILHDIRIFSGFPNVTEEGNTFYASNIELPDGSTLALPDSDFLVSGAAAMMMSDGKIDPSEYDLISKFADARGMSRERLGKIIRSVAEGTMQPVIPDDPVQGRAYLDAMATMCLADGKISIMETKLLYDIGEKINLDKPAVREILSGLRKNLLHKAKNIQ